MIHLLRKANMLYCEFDEVGLNKQLGYTSPADLWIYIHNFTSTTFQHTSKRLSDIECYIEQAQVDRKPLQQHLPGRTRAKAISSASGAKVRMEQRTISRGREGPRKLLQRS